MEGHHDSPTITDPKEFDINSLEGIEAIKTIFQQQHISPEVPPDENLESVWLSGSNYNFLATAEDTNGQYSLFDFYVPPQAGPPPHIHNWEAEAFYIADGQITFQMGNETMVGNPGDYLFLPKGHLHTWKNIGTESARVLVLTTPGGLEDYFRDAGEQGELSTPLPTDEEKVPIALAKYGIDPYPEAALLGKDKLTAGTAPRDANGGVYQRGSYAKDIFVGEDGNDIFLARAGKDIVYGGKGDDVLIGEYGDDDLDGGEGNDVISGRVGSDTLTGGGSQDIFTFIYSLSDDIDTITDFGGVGTGVNPTADVIAEADTLLFQGPGLSARNLLLTQDRNDLLITFEGVRDFGVILKNFAMENLDNLSTATGASVDIGNILFDKQTAIEDSFDVFDANQQSSVFNKNWVTFLNDLDNNTSGFDYSNDVLNGQGGDDKLEGLSGNDLLRGGTGNDILVGGLGSDTLVGGSGSDMLVLAAGTGTDTITDFTNAQDLIGLSDGLQFANMTITQGTGANANDTFLNLTNNNELLAILSGVQASTITSADFSIV
jgi:Ca2+-binding RTX toxin-like protein/quercetin dioxygenase-like cupin family protein